MDFSKYEPDLRLIVGVWKEIEALRRRVRSTPASIKQYRHYLTACIQKLRTQGADEPMLGEADLLAACRETTLYLEALYLDLDIETHAAGRQPVNPLAWCEKWLPGPYASYQRADSEANERQSAYSLMRLRESLQSLLREYVTSCPPTT